MTERELLAKIRRHLEACQASGPLDAAMAALCELEARAEEREQGGEDVFVWPQKVFDAALALFGPRMYARGGRTFRVLDARVKHACRVWDDKYGPWTPEQAEYAADLLASAFVAPRIEGNPYASVLSRLDRIVHHDRVHQGFLRRREQVAA